MALPWYGLIGGSKAALESVARHLTLEVGHRGVNVNVVKAGLVETDSTRKIPFADRMFAARSEKSMVGDRELTADDVANVVLFLASPLERPRAGRDDHRRRRCRDSRVIRRPVPPAGICTATSPPRNDRISATGTAVPTLAGTSGRVVELERGLEEGGDVLHHIGVGLVQLG